ncbi:MAG: 50S ribosomal protein L25 [Candidatus Eisenbacteria bacterium]|uniref:Large ribosomal subunit protein bL25 n=1 Tax=Eiseniibacteriota bacterium TaxID=2212470 RepID=A0A849T1Q8_UNCEI|nr:50S ribosomal protein L25 [Candidatus Eisenbacteria bacterium]
MAVIPLKGSPRDRLGKGGARKTRAAGAIPGVIYGHGETPQAVSVERVEFETAIRQHKGGNPIIHLALGTHEYTALLRSAQRDPLSQQIIHIDFQHISLTETVEVEVPVHLIGLSIGVKDGGGILEHGLREIEIRCLPTAIPTSIDIDVTALAIGDSIHVRDLKVEGVTILSDADAVVAVVAAPTVMEETTAAATLEGTPGKVEPEVITKGKKDEAAEGAEKEKKK